MLIELNKKIYRVQRDEFENVTSNEYNTLIIYPKLGHLERYASLINELRFNRKSNLIISNPTHGGFIPIDCSSHFENVILLRPENAPNECTMNIDENILSHNVNNISWSNLNIHINDLNTVFFSETMFNPTIDFLNIFKPILVCPENNEILISDLYARGIQLSNSNLFIYVPENYYCDFNDNFHFFIEDNILKYDNLIHLCIMVKNAGDQFENMLTKNLPYIDRWTILDTGSTDNTIDIINKVLVGKKKGELFCEPFINFKESRNRCLDLAGKTCKFTIMLDDTYIIENLLREFLHSIRGDQFSDSYSIYVKSDDAMYISNRILKTDRNLKYIYKIHEIVNTENNVNAAIPLNAATIFDYSSKYMMDRTINRKTYDTELLIEEIQENPDNPRHYYYIAQTYKCINKYELAHEFYLKRAYHSNEGFIQEKIDAFFEAARTAQFELNKPWNYCEKLYLNAYELDKSRPESLYYIGHYYYHNNNTLLAYEYFKNAFTIGYPVHCQHSLKPTLSYYFVPKFLTEMCYLFKDYKLGEKVSLYFLQNNNSSDGYYDVIKSWYNIFIVLNKAIPNSRISQYLSKPYFCFLADGGFDYWTGRDILTKGVGGSETYIIEMARYIQQHGFFNVVVFCKCKTTDLFEGVVYYSLNKYFSFISENVIHTCIISRFSEYLPVSLDSRIENIHMVIHDLTPSGVVIPIHPKLKKVFCLTEWHVEHMSLVFPQLKDRLVPFYYGIDFDKFGSVNNYSEIKIPYKFIYSSFPNRGLLQLLQMWPKIINIQPLACLHIYSDVDGKWVNSVEGEQMKLIRGLLNNYKNLNIHNHGWVGKKELADAWLTSDIWLYPCTFKETFCLTALEAAITKTFVVCPNLAALNNTVGNRGVIVDGDATTETWQNLTIDLLFNYLNNVNTKMELINKNYEWAKTLSWKAQSEKLLDRYIF